MKMSTMTEPTQCWLQCRLDKGMFSDEMAVTFPATGIHQQSVFIEKTMITGEPGQLGKVKVNVLDCKGHLMAVLPTPDQDIVWVKLSDLCEE